MQLFIKKSRLSLQHIPRNSAAVGEQNDEKKTICKLDSKPNKYCCQTNSPDSNGNPTPKRGLEWIAGLASEKLNKNYADKAT